MKREQYPLIYWWIRGTIGKNRQGFVIKQYKYGPVRTKYPDMTKVIASASQRKCRDLFKEAVVYAQKVMADPVQKQQWQNRIRNKRRVFVQVIRYYMLEAKRVIEQKKQSTNRLIRSCFKGPKNAINLTETVKESNQRGIKVEAGTKMQVGSEIPLPRSQFNAATLTSQAGFSGPVLNTPEYLKGSVKKNCDKKTGDNRGCHVESCHQL